MMSTRSIPIICIDFTYVKNKDTEFGDKPHKVSGMLLYAATDEKRSSRTTATR